MFKLVRRDRIGAKAPDIAAPANELFQLRWAGVGILIGVVRHTVGPVAVVARIWVAMASISLALFADPGRPTIGRMGQGQLNLTFIYFGQAVARRSGQLCV